MSLWIDVPMDRWQVTTNNDFPWLPMSTNDCQLLPMSTLFSACPVKIPPEHRPHHRNTPHLPPRPVSHSLSRHIELLRLRSAMHEVELHQLWSTTFSINWRSHGSLIFVRKNVYRIRLQEIIIRGFWENWSFVTFPQNRQIPWSIHCQN